MVSLHTAFGLPPADSNPDGQPGTSSIGLAGEAARGAARRTSGDKGGTCTFRGFMASPGAFGAKAGAFLAGRFVRCSGGSVVSISARRSSRAAATHFHPWAQCAEGCPIPYTCLPTIQRLLKINLSQKVKVLDNRYHTLLPPPPLVVDTPPCR
jgi:hypothetical protein